MSGSVESRLRGELTKLERPLAHAGFLVAEVRVMDEGTWGRLDAVVEGTNLSGKLQIHLGKKGKLSIVPQGNAARALAAALDGIECAVSMANPGRADDPHASGRESDSVRERVTSPAVRGNAGELVVDCSKFGGSMIGPTEWRGVEFTARGAWREVFRSAMHQRGHNNLGEFLAIVDACQRIERGELSCTTLLSDSVTALSWFRTGKIKTTINIGAVCDPTFARAVQSASEWLQAADRTKWYAMMARWDVSLRGENPADFGRK